MEYIENIMQNRYSCRNFKDEKIKDGVINEILRPYTSNSKFFGT